jgi:transcriptional regulator with XRE-family HTH domain
MATTTNDDDGDRFAQWLNLTMENRGVRATDLARRLKITDSAVSRWRSGTGVPSMDAALRLGKILNVDPARLAVTAGLLDGELADIKPLPMPEPTARRNRVKEQLSKIKGLTAKERQHLLNAYDENTEEGQK